MENNLAIPQKVKEVTYDPAMPLQGGTQENSKHTSNQKLTQGCSQNSTVVNIQK